jgi:uncharacterized protein YlaN (UPF0358 family)
MKETTTPAFCAHDGTIFLSREECERHEHNLLKADMHTFTGEVDFNWNAELMDRDDLTNFLLAYHAAIQELVDKHKRRQRG